MKKFGDMQYDEIHKVILLLGNVWSSGFHPWVPFVRSSSVKLVSGFGHKGWSRNNLTASDISTFQECVDVTIYAQSSVIMVELDEYMGDAVTGRRLDGRPVRTYVFEVLELGAPITNAVKHSFEREIECRVRELERIRLERLGESISGALLESIGIR